MKKGYSMIEVMVTIIVLGVMASLAIPNFATTMELYRSKEGVQVLYSLLQAQLSAGVDVDEGRIANYALSDLDITIPNMDHFTNPPVLDFDGSGSPPTVSINATNYPVYAHVDRSNGAYTLYVQADGTILCDTQAICTRMRYAPW